MTQWHFAEQRLDHVNDETTVSKNFARESRQLAGVFVREFFQNVLDARLTDANGEPVAPHVRISLSDKASGLSPDDLKDLHAGLHGHLTAAGHEPALWNDDRAAVLVLEEFGTSGLIGDTTNSRAKGTDERWANFWFGEGQRTKRGSALGRAGQGKITYHLVSGSQSIFAISNQNGGEADLLFGKCIVQKTHNVGGKDYLRHGYWPRLGPNDQPLPCDSSAQIQSFKTTFDLQRNGQTGTSWIIPYVDTVTFSKDRLISEILRDFFFSIMAGALTVEVMGTMINQTNIRQMIETYPIKDLPPEFVHFLEEAITLPDNDPAFIRAKLGWYGDGAETPMSDAAISEDDLEAARNTLDEQGIVAVHLPLTLSPVGGGKTETEISVFLKRPDNLSRTEEIYVRSGLPIGEEHHLRNAPGRFFGLMRAQHPAISEFLGFAEEASHMKWNRSEREVTTRYTNVSQTIAAVRHSLPKLAKLLLGHTSGRHDDALIDFLSIPDAGSKGSKAKTTRKKGKTGGGSGGGAERSLPRFRIEQSGSKWALTPGPGAAGLEYPIQIRIDLAYATMPGEGNPFKVYHRFEFDLSDETAHPLTITNGTVLSRDLNRLEVELTGPDFGLSVDGFSEHALKSRVRGLTP
ncbi:MAG: hypothetical protein AB7O43_12080 [Hyphomicrobiaceae bacterium]